MMHLKRLAAAARTAPEDTEALIHSLHHLFDDGTARAVRAARAHFLVIKHGKNRHVLVLHQTLIGVGNQRLQPREAVHLYIKNYYEYVYMRTCILIIVIKIYT